MSDSAAARDTDPAPPAPAPTWLDAPTTTIFLVPAEVASTVRPEGGPDAVAEQMAQQVWPAGGFRIVPTNDPLFGDAVDRVAEELRDDGYEIVVVTRATGELRCRAVPRFLGDEYWLTRWVRPVLAPEAS